MRRFPVLISAVVDQAAAAGEDTRWSPSLSTQSFRRTTAHAAITSHATIEASSMVLRTGRLASADPDWTPTLTAEYEPRQPRDLGC